MQLSEILYSYTNDKLKKLAKLCDGPSYNRKDDLVRGIHRTLMTPESLRQLWQRLDNLSQKAVAAAYHNDGEFNQVAFIARYGSLPERPRSRWSWYSDPILLDLFIHNGHLPSDLMPLLAELVPPPEKFQLIGLTEPPTTVEFDEYSIDLMRAETEQAGLHDLMAYLRLVDQGQVKISTTSRRATKGSIKKISAALLADDFLPLPEEYRVNQTIRPFGLDIFAQEAGLASKARGRNELQLTEAGRAFYQTQAPETLLDAFETWTQAGQFDELNRISALKGRKSKSTRLTPPASRREAVIEALSWCPAGVWIDIQDFYRALKIWLFDFEVEATPYSNLYVAYPDEGLYGDAYWAIVKGLYVNVVLWEYLGSIGALDLLYTEPEEANLDLGTDFFYYDELYFSSYDGLKYFRINNLGAYLLGQAGEYVPAKPLHQPLFTISTGLRVTVTQPDELTPNDRNRLEQLAVPLANGNYQLDTPQLLTALEAGAAFEHLAQFLQQRHQGPLPVEASTWLEQVKQNSQAFKKGEPALFIKAQSTDLVEMVLADPVLQKFCHLINQKTLVIPARREKAFRVRLKELEYILRQ